MISQFKAPCLSAGVLLIALYPIACEGGSNPYLTMEGKLTKRLVIDDLQSGVVGKTGNRWVIEPSGAWTRERVLNRDSEVVKKGTLSVDQIKSVAEAMRTHDLDKLPARTGNRTINPHTITIKFGRKKYELTLPAGAPPPRPTDDKPPSVPERIGGLLQEVQAVLEPKRE